VRRAVNIPVRERQPITQPGAVADLIRTILCREERVDRDKEHFWVIGLTTRNTVKYIDLVSMGTLNASLVHPRETFRYAVMKAVSAIILAHNHPSGSTEPSDDDLALTRRLRDAGHVLGIEVLDHVIVGGMKYTSFKERGLW
jgi:DNA repair protein RadC